MTNEEAIETLQDLKNNVVQFTEWVKYTGALNKAIAALENEEKAKKGIVDVMEQEEELEARRGELLALAGRMLNDIRAWRLEVAMPGTREDNRK